MAEDQSNGQRPSSYNYSVDEERAYQTLTILLDTAKAEYDAEQQRSSVFEARTGMLLTLLSALLVYEASTFSLPPKHVSVKLASLVITTEFLSIIALLIGIGFSIAVIRPRDYCRIKTESFASESEPIALMMRLIDDYVESIRQTDARTSHRRDHFNSAVYISAIGVFIFFIARIMQIYVT